MKAFILLFLITLSFPLSAQHPIDFSLLCNDWAEGVLIRDLQVAPAPLSRGGHMRLSISKDQTVTEYGADNCGTGSKKNGTWVLNTKDSTLTFTFYERVSYEGSQATTDMNEKITYRICKLTDSEFIYSYSSVRGVYFGAY